MLLPDGFQSAIFAAEPDVVQPISFCIDARGRIFVAEAHLLSSQRIHCDGSVFRVHPTKLIFENLADGNTNPWASTLIRRGGQWP